MKSNKGFTLVELLVTIVIMGVISGMAFPLVRGLQERNTYTKYEKYGESLEAAAKLYVNSFEEDVFRYEDDLTSCEQDEGQCEFISFSDLKEKNLVNDLSMDGVTCNSPYTFVKVTKRKGKYTYKYYLGCGSDKGIDEETGTLPENEIYFVLPLRDDSTDTTPYKVDEVPCNIPDSVPCPTA